MNNCEWIIGCEESQAIAIEMRSRGIIAYSCDIKPCTGGYPEYHIQDDIFKVIEVMKPKKAIIHPPCTYLTVTANKWLKDQPPRESGKLVGAERRQAKKEAEEFFIKLWNLKVDGLCLENPIGSINSIIPPTQIIQPYYFGDEAQKATCLWLKGLPPLYHNKLSNLFDQEITHVGKGEMVTFKSGNRMAKWYSDAAKDKDSATVRSKTFPGIAKAMAKQWG